MLWYLIAKGTLAGLTHCTAGSGHSPAPAASKEKAMAALIVKVEIIHSPFLSCVAGIQVQPWFRKPEWGWTRSNEPQTTAYTDCYRTGQQQMRQITIYAKSINALLKVGGFLRPPSTINNKQQQIRNILDTGTRGWISIDDDRYKFFYGCNRYKASRIWSAGRDVVRCGGAVKGRLWLGRYKAQPRME